jgi:hypothetical protein
VKPVGWRNESARHSLAAKGIKTALKSKDCRRIHPVGVFHQFYTCTSSEERAAAYQKGRVVSPGEVVRDPGDMGGPVSMAILGMQELRTMGSIVSK